jgi:hypothetical protein
MDFFKSFVSWMDLYIFGPENTTAIQANADLIYTWTTLTFEGYEEFWYASTDDDDSHVPSITGNETHFWYSVLATVVAITLYWFLVGGKFWERY